MCFCEFVDVFWMVCVIDKTLVKSSAKAGDIAKSKERSYACLREIHKPTLIADGYINFMVPTNQTALHCKKYSNCAPYRLPDAE